LIFLLAPPLAHDYILGFGFQLSYNLQIKPWQRQVALGAEPHTWPGAGYRNYQHVDLTWSARKVPFLVDPNPNPKP
jgi:hypothetical protein